MRFWKWWLLAGAMAVVWAKRSTKAKRFTIDLAFPGQPLAPALKQTFAACAKQWSTIITPNPAAATTYCFHKGTSQCGVNFTRTVCVDNLLIFVQVKEIDKVDGVLAQAGPCFWDELGMPRLGVMYFDRADVPGLRKTKRWSRVVLHEMGHVLGLGSYSWDELKLRTQTEPYLYLGVQGNLGNAEVGGPGPYAPLENYGGSGTAGAHWNKAVYGNELMTGFVAKPGEKMPLSLLTVRALQDLGYMVNVHKAEAYRVRSSPTTTALRVNNDDKLGFGNDVLRFPRNRQLSPGVTRMAKPGREEVKEY